MSPFALMSMALQHPDAEMLGGPRRRRARPRRRCPPSPAADALRDFLAWWAARARRRRCARRYVETFDFSRRTALDLTYYTHGDRRQRGLALLALRRRYDAAGSSWTAPSCRTTCRWCSSSRRSTPRPAASCWPSSGR